MKTKSGILEKLKKSEIKTDNGSFAINSFNTQVLGSNESRK